MQQAEYRVGPAKNQDGFTIQRRQGAAWRHGEKVYKTQAVARAILTMQLRKAEAEAALEAAEAATLEDSEADEFEIGEQMRQRDEAEPVAEPVAS